MLIVKRISHAEFLFDIEMFCSKYRMTARDLGIGALNDTAFVGRIRAGKSPTLQRVERVYDFMIAYERALIPAEGDYLNFCEDDWTR